MMSFVIRNAKVTFGIRHSQLSRSGTRQGFHSPVFIPRQPFSDVGLIDAVSSSYLGPVQQTIEKGCKTQRKNVWLASNMLKSKAGNAEYKIWPQANDSVPHTKGNQCSHHNTASQPGQQVSSSCEFCPSRPQRNPSFIRG